ncbi:ABC transporter permease [Paenibacillus crassostreae]|uniref:ABC transporter permease n=1 Tax=Paenibacillus crassostreae TaxID=1763538 RepID=A0A167GG97_9BACL|nr:ABC transporter permease [Paenibacillus crassostreae]AOZ91973.1 ABC transporter permease [Paenibacillus crassostreae]OAB77544.1 ABC transporter permease [Paenibacillus crassostreae]
MDLRNLRNERRRQFWGEIVPYLGYVMQSGVAVMFLFLFIAFSAWYTSLVQNIPIGLPIRWIMLVILLPLIVQSSFRTYLQSPDVVFLLPQESKMKRYLSGSWISGVVYKLLVLSLVFFTSWPLYIRSEVEPKTFWTFLILIFLLKIISSYGAWKEISMVSTRASRGYRLLRWAVMALAMMAWIWEPVGKSLIYVLLIVITYVLSLSIPMKHLVAWERLIAKEQSQIGRVMLVLGWFVNVPERQQRVYPRRLLSNAGNRLPWRSSSAYKYLITKSFIRSDILGIVMRAGILGVVLIWWTRGSLLGSGIYLFLLFLIGVQLSSLLRYHRESFWLNIYPVPAISRQQNVTIFVFQIHLLLAFILWLPLLGSGWEHASLTFGTLASGIVISFLIKAVLTRKAKHENDDD